jgi:hypothetical protein
MKFRPDKGFDMISYLSTFISEELISMKLNRLFLLSALLFSSCYLLAQTDNTIQFKNGPVHVQPNIKKAVVDSFNAKAARFNQKTFAVLQFETLPTEAIKKMLSANGIELLEYIPNNAYTVSISGNPNLAILEAAKARSIFQPSPEQKMETRLSLGLIPSSAIKIAGTLDVWISFPRTFLPKDVVINLKQLNMDVLSTQYQSYRILSVRIASNRLKDLASLPFIEYVQPAPGYDQPLNYNSRYGSRANLLNASIANGGKGLKRRRSSSRDRR